MLHPETEMGLPVIIFILTLLFSVSIILYRIILIGCKARLLLFSCALSLSFAACKFPTCEINKGYLILYVIDLHKIAIKLCTFDGYFKHKSKWQNPIMSISIPGCNKLCKTSKGWVGERGRCQTFKMFSNDALPAGTLVG